MQLLKLCKEYVIDHQVKYTYTVKVLGLFLNLGDVYSCYNVAGASKSAAIAMCYLSKAYHLNLTECQTLLSRKRWQVLRIKKT